MTEEDVVSIPAPPQVDLKRKLDDVESEQYAGSYNNSNGDIVDDRNAATDSSQAKRTKLEDGLGISVSLFSYKLSFFFLNFY